VRFSASDPQENLTLDEQYYLGDGKTVKVILLFPGTLYMYITSQLLTIFLLMPSRDSKPGDIEPPTQDGAGFSRHFPA
jgi:hypothetical protein